MIGPNDPVLNAARLKLGLLYQERANASFRHDDLRREIEEAFGSGKDREEALKVEEERFLAERDGVIQKKIDAASAEVEKLQAANGQASLQLQLLYQQRVTASFRHDELKAEIECQPPSEAREKALKAEDDRFIKERAAIQKKVDALSPTTRAA
jgi:hypothetical protein